jgi:Leucine-rich repeat (LRR) protein
MRLDGAGLTALPVLDESLIELSLSRNRLRSASGVGRLRHLRVLNLADNELTWLPSLRDLADLHTLDLGHNRLTSVLPPSLVQLTGLRELALRGNAIGDLPAWIRSLRGLRRLDLRSNGLRALPASLAELPELDKLDLRWNDVNAPWLNDLEAKGCVVWR